MLRAMSRIATLAALFLLAACAASNQATEPTDAGHAIALPPGKAAAVLGLTTVTPPHAELTGVEFNTYLYWITYDPASRRRVGQAALRSRIGCDFLSKCSPVIDNVQYQLYLVDPGSYAVSGIQYGTLYDIDPTRPDDHPPLQTVAPSFTVAPGEVAYVGNLVVAFGKTWWIGWSAEQDAAAARAFLAPTGLADRLLVRPMLRVDGTPINPTDGVPARPPRRSLEMPLFIPGKH
jgi:hypothetical protein